MWTTTTDSKGDATVIPMIIGPGLRPIVLWNVPKLPKVVFKLPKVQSFILACIEIFGDQIDGCHDPPVSNDDNGNTINGGNGSNGGGGGGDDPPSDTPPSDDPPSDNPPGVDPPGDDPPDDTPPGENPEGDGPDGCDPDLVISSEVVRR